MELDWFTLTAQVFNFLVLVWLLKRILYGRIVRAMNEREAEIARRLDDAAQSRATAEQEAELFRTKTRELEEQRHQTLAQAKEDAESLRQEMMETARLETEAAQTQWLEALERERQGLLQDLRERLGQQVFAIGRHGLKTIANADLEEQVLKVFVERLQTLNPAEREAIVAAVRDSDRTVEIRTAFPVRPEARETLSLALQEHLDDSVDVQFITAKELICGIELRADSHRLVWSLDSHIENLEDRVAEILDKRVEKHVSPR